MTIDKDVMDFTKAHIPICTLILLVFACSRIPDDSSIYLSGKIDSDVTGQSTFVAIAKNEDMTRMENLTADSLIDLIEVDHIEKSFDIELSEKGLVAGDEVAVFAFVDKDYRGGIPSPGNRDRVGMYYNSDTLSTAYILNNGMNDSMEISLNRKVYAFDSTISGTIRGMDTGVLTLVAYAGEITSSDFSKLDFNCIVGLATLTKGPAPLPFDLPILPYFPDSALPPDFDESGGEPPEHIDVYIFALLDRNQNNTIDAGDRAGYYELVPGEEDWPAKEKIYQGQHKLDHGIDLLTEIHGDSDVTIFLKGSVTLPAEYQNDTGVPGPVYLVVADTEEMNDDYSISLSSIKYFERVSPQDSAFDIDLSSTDLEPGDEVMVFALWDRDYSEKAPDLTSGDFLGIFIDTKTLSPALALTAGDNQNIDVNLFRKAFSFDARISGTVGGPDTGDLTLIAYAGEILSSEISDLDFDSIIGFETITKGDTPASFSMEVMPYLPDGFDRKINEISDIDAINRVYVAALLDANHNGAIDSGDKVGYLGGENGLPMLLNLHAGENDLNPPEGAGDTGIKLTTTLTELPSFDDFSLTGPITVPFGYYSDFQPIYISVIKMTGFDQDDLLSSIKCFKRLRTGENHFYFDLSGTGLVPGDEVMVYAFWDKDYSGRLPFPNTDDTVGYCQNNLTYQFSVILEEGSNFIDPLQGWELDLNKKIYDHRASIEFTLDEGQLPDIFDSDGDGNNLDPGDQVIMIAAHQDGVFDYWSALFSGIGDPGLDPSFIFGMPDMDYILGMKIIRVGMDADADGNYSMDLLPMISEDIAVQVSAPMGSDDPPSVTISGVYLFAILDHNFNGIPDIGEFIGYYSIPYYHTIIPEMIVVTDKTTLDDPVRFTDHTTVGLFHRLIVTLLQILEMLLGLQPEPVEAGGY